MAEGINTDKVIVNAGGGGHDGGGSMAAVIAALGNRNQGNDNAALIAALGNRNDGHRGDDGFGLGGGGGILGLLAILGLLRGRGGLGGDDCGDGGPHGGLAGQFLMSKLGSIEGAIPLAASQIGNEICRSTGEVVNQLSQSTLAQLAASAGVKDSVQNGFALTNTNLLEGLCRVVNTVRDDGDRTRGQIALYHEANLQRQLGVAEAALAEERTSRRVRDVEVSMTQTVNQTQAQAQAQQQQQAQFSHLFGLLGGLANQLQISRQAQDIVNLGTMTASGTQAAANTQVR